MLGLKATKKVEGANTSSERENNQNRFKIRFKRKEQEEEEGKEEEWAKGKEILKFNRKSEISDQIWISNQVLDLNQSKTISIYLILIVFPLFIVYILRERREEELIKKTNFNFPQIINYFLFDWN